ncbi:MAG: hypothetical protein ABI625_26970, partial [bacterium]
LVAQKLSAEFCFTERVMPAEGGGLYQARYLLPAAFQPRVLGRRIAIVDDVMSAGSALRGTYSELRSHGAEPVVAGALLQLGDVGEQFFAEQGVAVQAVARDDYTLWRPEECPHCEAGTSVEKPAG